MASRNTPVKKVPIHLQVRLRFASLFLRLNLAKLLWLGGVVVSVLGMRTRRSRFESRVAPLGSNLGQVASPVFELQEAGVQKGVFGA